MATQNTIRFTLVGITTEQFAKIFIPEENRNLELNISVSVNSNYNEGAIAITPTINFKESENPFLLLECTCHFKIEPSDWDLLTNSSKTNATIPKDTIRHMVALSLSTARGILHGKTENSDYNKFYLPLIDSTSFDGGDIVIEIESNDE